MESTVADIFRKWADMDSFRCRVEALEGAFRLGAEEMMELGNAVLERFPSSAASSAQPAYTALRICLLEKALGGVPRDLAQTLRKSFVRTGEAALSIGPEAFQTETLRYLPVVESALEGLQSEFENLPKGVIRERYAGGIAALFNVTYLLRNSLTESSGSDPDEHEHAR